MSADLLPPHNLEMERAVLGAILIDNRAIDKVTDILEGGHFYDFAHQVIYESAVTLVHAGKQASPISLKHYFDAMPETPGYTTIPKYLGTLVANATTTSFVREYAQIVRELAVRRELVNVGKDLAALAQDCPVETTTADMIRDVETSLYGLAERGVYGKGSVPIKEILDDVLVDCNDAHMRGGKPLGLMTDFRDLDAKLQGLEPGNLIILAARPSMGKTALALNIAWNIARKGVAVQFDSLEMSAKEIGRRLLAEVSGINGNLIRTGGLQTDGFRALVEAKNIIAKAPLFVDDAGGLNIGKMAARARRVKRQRGIGCLVIDYLQLMAGGSQNRVADITDISAGLKALAKELDVPIIALSQLSRKCEERQDKRPLLSDLRESGSIEQDADVVMFVYRDEYYLERAEPDMGDSEHRKWQERLQKVAGKAEVIIAKQRHGAVGTVHMAFEPSLTRFSDLAREPHPSMRRYE